MRAPSGKAWVVSVNMGYGHERAAFGLKDLASGGIVTANNYPGIPDHDKDLWNGTRSLYETISRLQPVPIVGDIAFGAMDYFQRIPPFYPRRDLSHPTIQLTEIYRLIEKKGLGQHLIEKLSKRKIPFISSFFIPAFAAEVHNYPGDIYLICCDADISRAWAPLDPKTSRIKYFAPNGRVVERLKLYGVREENIFLTGFPLPKTLIGGQDAHTVKRDLAERICHLDPNGYFSTKYQDVLVRELGPRLCSMKPKRPLTITFCVGGAGAQKQIGFDILESLQRKLKTNDVQVNLEAGTRRHIADEYVAHVKKLGLGSRMGKSIHVHTYPDRKTYFTAFTHTLRSTDILWTKPSELSFYTGVGLPIIIAPPVGSQEDFNKTWLLGVNGGIPQLDPRLTNEWLFDWVDSGGLARFAWNGYVEAPTHGAYRIESIITKQPTSLASLPLIV